MCIRDPWSTCFGLVVLFGLYFLYLFLKVFQVFSLGVETSLLSTWRILALRLIDAWPESATTRINLLKHRVIKVFSKGKFISIIVFYYKSIIIKVFIIKVFFPTNFFLIHIWNLNSYGSRLIIRARYYSLHLPYLLSLVDHLDSVFQIYLPSFLDISF